MLLKAFALCILLAGPAGAEVYELAYGGARLLTADARTLKMGRQQHLVMAYDDQGRLVGAVLNRRGEQVCALAGGFDRATGCLAVVGCGSLADRINGCP